MAKTPKKRTKKGSIQTFKRKEIDAIVNNCYQRIKFLGDCFHTPRACGIQRLWTHLRGPYHDIGMECFLRHLSRKMDWSFNISYFFKDKDNEELVHVVQVLAVLQDCVMEEVSTGLTQLIIESTKLCLELNEHLNNKTLVYYAYTLYPEFNENYDLIGDGLTDLMINLDNISSFKPFGNSFFGNPSDRETLLAAIKNNSIYPRVKIQNYWPVEEEIIAEDITFLTQRPVNEVICETL